MCVNNNLLFFCAGSTGRKGRAGKKTCFSKLERKSTCISFKYCIQLRLWREKYNLLSNLQSYEMLSWS